MHSHLQPIDASRPATECPEYARVDRLVWGFVVLGTIIRLVGYLLRFPLWVDECMLAENFLDRDFLGLLSPLDNQQVAPIGFLWIELACVRVFGFSEWSLRLFPLICGIGSLYVFRHMASRLLTGAPLVLAVGCLAVAKAPAGLSANVKPYACDLFAAVVLLALAVEWLRRPERRIWLWSLAALLPVAIAISFPAVFVAGAVSLGLMFPVWRRRQLREWSAFAACQVSLAVSIAGLYWVCLLTKSTATQALMIDYWTQQDGFPPWDAWHFLYWLTTVHVGDKIFAVPYGAEFGGGLIALGLCLAGAIAMYRRSQRAVLTMFLATFGLSFLGAALRIYPYGGHNRLTQFLVPSIAISIGAGAAAIETMRWNSVVRRALTRITIVGLGLFGCGICIRDVIHPYHHVHDQHHREFARRFWQDEPHTTTICAFTDLGQKFCELGWDAYYRCNQQIYATGRRWGQELPVQVLNVAHQPLRLVVFRPPACTLDLEALSACLERLENCYELTGHESFEPCRADVGFDKYGGYEVFRFKSRFSPKGARFDSPGRVSPGYRYKKTGEP